jgi:Protein of unknown function (DUF3515)
VLRRRPGLRWTRGAAACAAALPLLAGCGDDPVRLDGPRLDEATYATCQDLVGDLPEEVAEEPRRLVAPASASGAAWGDPPIVLRCGAEVPTDFDRFATCVEANGVGWYVPGGAEEQPDADVTITAAGYRPVVQVEVPGEHRPEGAAAAMAELAAAVEENLELINACE